MCSHKWSWTRCKSSSQLLTQRTACTRHVCKICLQPNWGAAAGAGVLQLIRTIDFRLPRLCVCVCGRKAAGREGGRQLNAEQVSVPPSTTRRQRRQTVLWLGTLAQPFLTRLHCRDKGETRHTCKSNTFDTFVYAISRVCCGNKCYKFLMHFQCVWIECGNWQEGRGGAGR